MSSTPRITRRAVRNERDRLTDLIVLLEDESEGQEEAQVIIWAKTRMAGAMDALRWILDKTGEVVPPSIQMASTLHEASGRDSFIEWIRDELGIDENGEEVG